MTKNCYLHLGFHKTATSSLQITFGKNNQLLNSLDIYYPLFIRSAVSKQLIANHSVPIHSLFCKNPRKYHINIRWNLCDKIDEVNTLYAKQLDLYLEGSNNIILSGEDISILEKDALKKLVEKIKSYDYKVHIFALVRRPYGFYCSSLQEAIKNGSYNDFITLNDDIPSNHINLKSCFNSHVVEKLQSTFHDNIKFYNFENACKHSYGPVGFIIDKILKLDPSLFDYCNINQSLFNLTVRLQNEQNKLNPAIVNGKNNPNHISFQHLNNNLSSSGKFLLTKNEYNAIKESFEIENMKYLNLLGKDFIDKSIQFSKPIINE